jgi:cephalosporin hydroxylase
VRRSAGIGERSFAGRAMRPEDSIPGNATSSTPLPHGRTATLTLVHRPSASVQIPDECSLDVLMDEIAAFEAEVRRNIAGLQMDWALRGLSNIFLRETCRHKYTYNFTWLGRPIIHLPQDMVALQEIIWRVRPTLIIETGIAHGGSVTMSASMLALLDYCDAVEAGKPLDPRKPRRRVLGIDIDIRAHNRVAIEAHPMSGRIEMVQGSSVAPEIIAEVYTRASDYECILVCLDSNHTHEHVLAELEAYAPLTTMNSYCIVCDTVIEDMPDGMFPDRPWGKENNPKTAVREYLRWLELGSHRGVDGGPLRFEIDRTIENKLLITDAPDGYLRRI